MPDAGATAFLHLILGTDAVPVAPGTPAGPELLLIVVPDAVIAARFRHDLAAAGHATAAPDLPPDVGLRVLGEITRIAAGEADIIIAVPRRLRTKRFRAAITARREAQCPLRRVVLLRPHRTPVGDAEYRLLRREVRSAVYALADGTEPAWFEYPVECAGTAPAAGLPPSAADAAEAVARECAVVAALLAGDIGPEQTSIVTVERAVFAQRDLDISAHLVQRGADTLLQIAERGGENIGSIDLLNRAILPAVRHADPAHAREVLRLCLETAVADAGGPDDLPGWASTVVFSDPAQNIAEISEQLGRKDWEEVAVTFDSDRERTLDEIHALLWKQGGMRVYRRRLSDMPLGDWPAFLAALRAMPEGAAAQSLPAEVASLLRALVQAWRDRAATERAIVRLAELGVIDDYETDEVQRVFTVRVRHADVRRMEDGLTAVLRDVLPEGESEFRMRRIDGLPEETPLLRCVHLLSETLHERCVAARSVRPVVPAVDAPIGETHPKTSYVAVEPSTDRVPPSPAVRSGTPSPALVPVAQIVVDSEPSACPIEPPAAPEPAPQPSRIEMRRVQPAGTQPGAAVDTPQVQHEEPQERDTGEARALQTLLARLETERRSYMEQQGRLQEEDATRAAQQRASTQTLLARLEQERRDADGRQQGKTTTSAATLRRVAQDPLSSAPSTAQRAARPAAHDAGEVAAAVAPVTVRAENGDVAAPPAGVDPMLAAHLVWLKSFNNSFLNHYEPRDQRIASRA
jgi:hypothetical protein